MIVSATLNTMSQLFLGISAGQVKAEQIKRLPPTEDEVLLKAYHDDQNTFYLINIKTASLPVLIMLSNFYGVGVSLN